MERVPTTNSTGLLNAATDQQGQAVQAAVDAAVARGPVRRPGGLAL